MASSRYRKDQTPGPGKVYLGQYEINYNRTPPYILKSAYYYNFPYYGRNFSKVKSCHDETHPGPPYRSGGPLDLLEWEDGGCKLVPFSHENSYGGITYSFSGDCVCTYRPSVIFYNYGYNSLTSPSTDALNHATSFGNEDSRGAEAWNRFRPGKPAADIAQFIAEIGDTPRMIRTTALGFRNLYRRLRSGHFTGRKMSREVAEHHLNTQFGWLPFVSDLRKFHQTYVKLDKHVYQLIRDNGKWIRRGGTVVEQTIIDATKAYSTPATAPVIGALHYPGPIGSHNVTYRRHLHVWFSGAFRYWMPQITVSNPNWYGNAVAHIYGARVNPEVVWNITPFSWLVDWFSNVGDVVSNIQASYSQNLAAKYAYLMAHTKITATVESTYCGQTSTFVYTMERKRRGGANPFGFGLSWGNLSARQWSILGALGLTRLRD